MKKALLLCASHNDLGLVRALRKLGYYIIVTGNIDGAPGQRWCDKYIKVDYSNNELILEIAKTEKIDAIVQCCNDFGVYTAAYVAEKLGLPGYDNYETTLILHNKDKFKEFAQKYNILTPKSKSFKNAEDAIAYLQVCTYPVIVKPVDASAGNGINTVNSIDDGKVAIDSAFKKSRDKRIVIEPFIVGTQHGFCTFLRDKRVVAVCSNNEYSIKNKYRVEMDTFPADNFLTVKDVLIKQIERIANVFNLKDGIFHLQYIYDGEKPQIIEVMRRILGNMYHVPGNELTGIDWEYWETRARCGLSLDSMPQDIRQEGYFAYKTILAPSNGIIEKITIPRKFDKYTTNYFLLKSRGDKIENCRCEPVGFIFMMFSDYLEMKRVLVDDYDSDIVRMRGELDE